MAESKVEIETSSEDMDKYCDACKEVGETNVVAVFFCQTCKQYQCEICNGMHKRIPSLKGHTIDSVNDQVTVNEDFGMHGIDRCENHNELAKFFCKTEDQLCCSNCVLSTHLKCVVVEIDELTGTNDTNMVELQTTIQEGMILASKLMSSSARCSKDLREDQENLIQEIDKIKVNAMQLIDTFKEEFHSETDEAISTMCHTSDSELTKSKHINEDFRRIEAFMNDVAKEGTPAQVFSAITVYTKQVSRFMTSLKQSLSQMFTLNINLDFNEKLIKFVEMTDSIATMSVERIDVFNPMELRTSYVASVDVNELRDENEPFYTGIDFLSDDRVIAVDNKNSTCVVMNGQLSVLGRNKVNKQPYDCCALADSTVAISYGNSRSHDQHISLHIVHKYHTHSVIKTFKTKASYFSLDVLNEDTLVANTIECDQPAKLVTLDEEEKDIDFPFPPKVYALGDSKTTCIPSLDILVLTDKAADKCYLWNVKENTSIVVEDERIKEPRGVCATSSGVIFVCSSATHSIVQISPKGKVLGSFQLATYCPYSVAVSRDDKKLLLFKKCERQMKLQLFKLI